MKKITKLALCVSLTLLMVGAYFVVSAATGNQAGPPRNLSGLHIPPPTNYEGLRSNFITTSTPYASLTAGFNVLDSVQWNCGSGGFNSCTLVVDSFATSSGGGIANDDRALCLVLDGEIVGACAYDGYDAADGSYSAINAINNVSGIPTGAHNSSVLFYTTDGTTMYTYTNVYNVYKP
ncbi:MAG TPA: hypothetical protein VMH04_21525 [Candidatus Solibacter sp.]|nr:hypothetical protein [Candidatus Solibacter sp.]